MFNKPQVTQNEVTTLISFPKCGRTWIRLMLGFIINKHFDLNLAINSAALLHIENLTNDFPDMPMIKLEHDDDAFFKKPEELSKSKALYEKTKIIFLVRDPRDVIVSAYFHKLKRRNFFPTDKSRTAFASYNGNLSDFIREEQGSLFTLVEYYNIWERNIDRFQYFLLLRYEDMVKETNRELHRLLDFLGIGPISDNLIAKAIEFACFENMQLMEEQNFFNTGILKPTMPGDKDSFKTRRGKIGGYTDYLSTDDISFMNSEISNRSTTDLFQYSLTPCYNP